MLTFFFTVLVRLMDKYARLMQKLEIVNVELFKVFSNMQMCEFCAPTSDIAALERNYFVFVL